MREKASICVRNNAEWCDGVCRAHGIPGHFTPEIWTQPRPGPPYYSNAITLSPDRQERQRAAIETLHATLPNGFSVKDAFDCLDLSQQGFRTLFEAEWVWLDSSGSDALPKGHTAWSRIETETDLRAWESAWAASGSPTTMRVFLPALLNNPAIAFFGAKRDGVIVAGCIANRSSDDVVGFSNFFASSEGRGRYRAAAAAKTAQFADGLPVVGYHRGDELDGLLALGFRTVGRLRVWLRD